MTFQKNQTGFSHVHILLVVAVVTVIGIAGWLVLGNKQEKKADAPKKQTVSSYEDCVAAGNPIMESFPEQCAANGKTFTNTKKSASATPTTVDETANWLLYTAPGNEYRIKLADGWNLTRYEKTTGLATFENTDTTLKPVTKAVVTEVNGGKDGQTGFFFNYATQNIEQIVTPGTKQASLKTADGLEIEKYSWVVSGYSEMGLGVSNGDTEYTYVIRQSAKKVVTVSYSFHPGDTDNSSTIEKSLKTLHFN